MIPSYTDCRYAARLQRFLLCLGACRFLRVLRVSLSIPTKDFNILHLAASISLDSVFRV